MQPFRRFCICRIMVGRRYSSITLPCRIHHSTYSWIPYPRLASDLIEMIAEKTPLTRRRPQALADAEAVVLLKRPWAKGHFR